VCVQQIVRLCTEYALGERTTEPGCWGVVTGWCSLERFSEAARYPSEADRRNHVGGVGRVKILDAGHSETKNTKQM
jgi:hypothetical protein